MTSKVIPVLAGRFTCPHCGRSWLGSWHGEKDEMTCIFCNALLFPKENRER